MEKHDEKPPGYLKEFTKEKSDEERTEAARAIKSKRAEYFSAKKEKEAIETRIKQEKESIDQQVEELKRLEAKLNGLSDSNIKKFLYYFQIKKLEAELDNARENYDKNVIEFQRYESELQSRIVMLNEKIDKDKLAEARQIHREFYQKQANKFTESEITPEDIDGFLTEQHTESKENAHENLVERIVEVPSEVGERIEKIKKNLVEAILILKKYEQLDNEPLLLDETAINRIRSKLESKVSEIMGKFGFTYHMFDLPNERQITSDSQYDEFLSIKHPWVFRHPGPGIDLGRAYRVVQYLPETIEAAYLANDEFFSAMLSELIFKLEKYKVASTETKKRSAIYGNEKILPFFKLFTQIPVGDEEKIRNFLQAPMTRVSHSVFTHVSSEGALDGILKSKSIRSSSLVPPSSTKETGAFSGTSRDASDVEKSAIYFDQNNISPGYGTNERNSRGLRRIWFATRGDKLLEGGLVDRQTLEDRHPFLFGHNRFGTIFDSFGAIPNEQGREVLGTEIPIDKFIIVVPRGAEDLIKRIKASYPGATIETYDVDHEKRGMVDIDVVRNLSVALRERFGNVKNPELAISAVNKVEERAPSGFFHFPVTSKVLSEEESTSKTHQTHEKLRQERLRKLHEQLDIDEAA